MGKVEGGEKEDIINTTIQYYSTTVQHCILVSSHDAHMGWKAVRETVGIQTGWTILCVLGLYNKVLFLVTQANPEVLHKETLPKNSF